MLIYPPGKFGQTNLPMFTFIHGGPEDADGNHFEADWYQWADLAATDGWLVFEPNYRGSVGYGDAFALGIIPHIVSRPGKDILEGVDALVKNGIADPNHLTVGGYSYGGYMTNWLITQTTRFKAAVTGAGAVEHVANWGNDDTTMDDAYFLGGLPWKAEENYNAEAAIWQIGKVSTPTHMVAGADDIRVYVGEDYLLERALHTLGIPSALLIFPGEGHGLGKNPWHGKIKVREELKWLDRYGRNQRGSGFDQQKIADDQRIRSGTEIAANGVARRDHKRLAEKIERGIQQNRRGSLRAECFQERPEIRIRLARNDVQPDNALRQAGRKQLAVLRTQAAHRGHEPRCGRRRFEVLQSVFLRHGQRERPEGLAMLHVVIQIFLHVGSPRRREQAAIAERARAEFRRALEPADNFPRTKKLHRFVNSLLIGSCPSVHRLAIVEHLLDFLVRITRTQVHVREFLGTGEGRFIFCRASQAAPSAVPSFPAAG